MQIKSMDEEIKTERRTCWCIIMIDYVCVCVCIPSSTGAVKHYGTPPVSDFSQSLTAVHACNVWTPGRNKTQTWAD